MEFESPLILLRQISETNASQFEIDLVKQTYGFYFQLVGNSPPILFEEKPIKLRNAAGLFVVYQMIKSSCFPRAVQWYEKVFISSK